MKKLIIFLLAIASFAAIEWQNDFYKAHEASLKSGKPLFVFIERHNPPCRWCQLMKKRTLGDEEIANYINENFIPVKLVREKRDYPKELYPKYVPTIYVIKGQKVIKRVVGYWPKSDFLSDIEDLKRALEK
ncbi:MAG: hypothetical protein C6H99_00790 [Epsilonproteobacteria bacterium]|nr:hypothetical protein [Campylobacterota bacterium]NPA64798.1 DUF255 domain-containing protein [Campylobacterota bacterium]